MKLFSDNQLRKIVHKYSFMNSSCPAIAFDQGDDYPKYQKALY
ncbi:hypothetical protein RV03_GL001168 [Enterococcus gallinarum]|nr:hypothetical protein RV03_GL001168 [Enterococcus gallinarum]